MYTITSTSRNNVVEIGYEVVFFGRKS